MKMLVYKDGMSPEKEADVGYFDRNMLALLLANLMREVKDKDLICGWYYDTENNWDGWKRVIALFGGSCNFHVPDDFDLGTLQEIEPVYDGHTTEEKWKKVAAFCGCKLEK
jgi:hypothetical protein